MSDQEMKLSRNQFSKLRLIENKMTGERFDVLVTGAETEGAYAEAIVTVPAGFKPLPVHSHPKQSEEFTVLSGQMGVMLNDEKIVLKEGDYHKIPAGAVHTWWNAGETELKVKSKVEPVLHFPELIGTLYESANERQQADPSMIDAVYVLTKYKDEYDPVFLPKPVRLFLFPLIYYWGRLSGRHRILEQYIARHYEKDNFV